jgi:hypothetical protein
MKKVIHVVDSLDAGGAQEIIYSLSKYLKEYEIIIVFLKDTIDNQTVL